MSIELPSLPGYKPKLPMRAIRMKHVPDDPTNDIVKNSPKKKLTSMSVSDDDAVVLTFQAYFLESYESSERPRMCQINYYVATSEISVIAKPQITSNVPAGTYIKRDAYSNMEGEIYQPSDFDFDKPMIIHGTTFFIVDCDYDTREFLRRKKFGIDATSTYSSTNDKNVTIDDEWGKFHSKKNDNKTFQEAMLGNSVDNTRREGFLRFGTNVLKFRLRKHDSTVDDIVQDFSLVYNLADDTVEIFSLGDYNGNRHGVSKLLRRSKLPKQVGPISLNKDAYGDPLFYHWSEFCIGYVINVYNRQMRVIDADAYSRRVYDEVGNSLGPAEIIDEPETPQIEREIPPATGFGSEEDSLRSCTGSLNPGVPRVKNFGPNKSLNFKAKLLNGTPDDTDREFVISFYFLDGTIKATEPPRRNSGFVGGVFISRRKVKLADGTDLNENHFYMGAKIVLTHQEFLLIESDSRTFQVMEEVNHPKTSFPTIMAKLQPSLSPLAQNGSLTELFSRHEGKDTGESSFDTLLGVLSSLDLVADEEDKVTLHEIITVMRTFSVPGKIHAFNYESFVAALLE